MERKYQLLSPGNRGNFVEGVFINKKIPFQTTIFCINCQINFYKGNSNTIGSLAAQQIAMQHGEALHHTIYQATNESIL